MLRECVKDNRFNRVCPLNSMTWIISAPPPFVSELSLHALWLNAGLKLTFKNVKHSEKYALVKDLIDNLANHQTSCDVLFFLALPSPVDQIMAGLHLPPPQKRKRNTGECVSPKVVTFLITSWWRRKRHRERSRQTDDDSQKERSRNVT